MDFNKVECFDNKVIIKDSLNFKLNHIFDCGQCFRWNKQKNGNYIGVAFNKVIEIKKEGKDIIIYNTNEKDFKDIWVNYFDLYRDYSSIKEIISKDCILKKSVKFGEGIRILNQEPFEIIVSFIISANNRILMIKKAIEKISENWGKRLEYKGNTYYGFPDINILNMVTEEEFKNCGVGFRAKYIKNTINNIYIYGNSLKKEYLKEYDINWIKHQEDGICHKELQKFSGIGPKVADCIMLFSMQKYSAFPVDIWVKRFMQKFYLAPDVSLKKIRDFGRKRFGKLSGFAQQYLFYYARENKINVD